MKCALIIPSWVPEDIFPTKTASSQINYWQPLGTLYVASSLQRAGHTVKFYNGAFMTHAEILKEIETYKPEFAGVYSTAFGWSKAKKTAADIKRLDRQIFTCAGGPYPVAAQEQCLLDEGADAIDAVVTGEGELAVPELLERLQQGESLDGVDGVIYRDSNGIVKNPPRPLISDLDSIPFPARELLGDKNLYIPPPATYRRKPVAVMMTSRGCNRRCIYCFQLDKKRKSGIRYRSVENVLDEIELCIKQGFREIKFIDDTFAADYDRAMHIAQEIKSRQLDFTWFVSACVNQVDKPLLKEFKEAGCWAILMGAESGVQKNLNKIKKGITLEQTKKAVREAKEVGLKVITPFIFGIPGETFEEGLRTIEFACELDPDIANFHAITPFPGTELYDNVGEYGAISKELTDFTYQGAAFVPFTMTREEIVKLRSIAFRRFYSRPKLLLKRLLEIRNMHDLRAAGRGIRSLFWLWVDRDVFRRTGARSKNPGARVDTC
ncbi:MAG: radical SAM protein [Actinobacteria bacterium]|nr:radical SAM protein [Actinomycetota bacterium]